MAIRRESTASADAGTPHQDDDLERNSPSTPDPITIAPSVPHGLLHQLELLLVGEASPPRPHPSEPPPPIPPPPLAPPIQWLRNPRARRYILRVGSDGVVRVTIPRGGSAAFARQFVREKADWIHDQLERLRRTPRRRSAWGPDTPVWYRGTPTPLVPLDGHCRLGDLLVPVPPAGEDWRPGIERALRNLASRELPPLVFATAAAHGLSVARVQVRDQKTRWGSCSRRGTVSLNWRLVQTPVFVRDYLVAHELAHLRQMNHSPRFWKVVEDFFPSWREAERWLRRHGRQLHA